MLGELFAMMQYKTTDKDCLQCCVAGLLDFELSQVPTWSEWMDLGRSEDGEERWFKPFVRWCRTNTLLTPVGTGESVAKLRHICVVRSERGVAHAVVAEGNEVVWDPSYPVKGVEAREVLYRIVFVPNDIFK